jgi:hypothetical protein
MPRDIEVQNPAAVVAHDEEAVEHTERDRGDGKEIHGNDGFEGRPASAWWV